MCNLAFKTCNKPLLSVSELLLDFSQRLHAWLVTKYVSEHHLSIVLRGKLSIPCSLVCLN